ncbi:hypothetical protein [Spartinivicinus poritis]|uniref:Secreted protein n=1 Tax=Spartinivicinus poritis TaxID=2994640 RepID=A0ABT5UG78_9GAMM|nr:hypothetical protein [Spartinivicinus sp. A2-2]MDE1465395.1 hypothetical protein [Spartinivicinus sp. A2-2]
MLKKTTLALLTTSLLSGNALAGITLCSTNYPNEIVFHCDHKLAPFPIPASENSTQCWSLGGISDVSWFAMKIQGLDGHCVLVDHKDNLVLGGFDLSITTNNNEGKVSNARFEESQFLVNISPASGEYLKEVTVNIINLQ